REKTSSSRHRSRPFARKRLLPVIARVLSRENVFFPSSLAFFREKTSSSRHRSRPFARKRHLLVMADSGRLLMFNAAGVAKLAYAADSKSAGVHSPWGFKSLLRHSARLASYAWFTGKGEPEFCSLPDGAINAHFATMLFDDSLHDRKS